MDATAIILAAGEGTRMKSNHCKVSHKILGKPMVQWIVDATIKAGCSRVVVVIGSHADEMRALIDGAYANSATKVECVEQTERLGTGHAVSVLELVNTFMEATGVNVPYVIAPRREGDLPQMWADTHKGGTILGWKAEKTVADMCRDSWNFVCSVKKQ